MNIKEALVEMKAQSPVLGATPVEKRNEALSYIIEELKADSAKIFKANEKDLEEAHKANLADAIIQRLKFNEKKLEGLVAGLADLIKLPDPLFKTTLARQLDEGLNMYRRTCPIGVIGIIFEARPDALVQISSLCIKSGNCAVLKGGSETFNTNRVLFQSIQKALVRAGISEYVLFQAEERTEISELLKYDEYVDLIIPRGSNAFVRYIMDNTKIPVLGHADGKCHIYVDTSADFEKALKVIVDSKTQYVSVCNAVEALLVNRAIAKEFLPLLAKTLADNNVTVKGNKEVSDYISCDVVEDAELVKEYLDYIVSVRIVEDEAEAIQYINKNGSHHTDCIIAEDKEAVAQFMRLVDSAGVYNNCSTRFADGYRYGFGAEVGVSTVKIHARGPVGLEGMVTYKYEIYGNGHIVDDYASGKKEFHFKELE
nr:glutamate-5-semialdehyde dehydrogenase [uncultured Lachnoclostridium sp.]